MAFTVEDGTGLSDANSYTSVAEADAYFLDRGNGVWDALDADIKQQSLIKATDYLEQRFGSRFLGTSTTEIQALHWPVGDLEEYDVDEIPIKLKYACAEYGYRASQAELAPDPAVDSSGVTMVRTRQVAGPVEQSFRALDGSAKILRDYPTADMYLRDLVTSNSGVIR